jgi:hypothetical protein
MTWGDVGQVVLGVLVMGALFGSIVLWGAIAQAAAR